MLAHFISITVAIRGSFPRGRAILRRPGRAGTLYRGRDALAPRLPVADGEYLGIEVLELRQRVEARRRAHVERPRHQLRAAGAGQRIERAELVAGYERPDCVEVQRAMARGVAWRMDDAGPPGHVKRLAVRVGRQLTDRPRLHRACSRERDEQAPSVPEAEVRQERRLTFVDLLARRGE